MSKYTSMCRGDTGIAGEAYIPELNTGRKTYLYGTASVLRDSTGNIVGAVESIRDITERKKAEEKTAQLSAIVEYTDDAIIGKNLDGNITSWNRGAENIYGYTASEVIGKPVSILLPPGSETEGPRLIERIKSGEHIQHYETVRRRKDGRHINVSDNFACPKRRTQDCSGINDWTRYYQAQAGREGVTRERGTFLQILSYQHLGTSMRRLSGRPICRRK